MGHTIQETTVTVFIGNYIRGVNVIKGSLYSRVYGKVVVTTVIRSTGLHNRKYILIGASLSEPHTSESNCGFFIYILYIIHRTSFRKYKLTLLTRNVVHAEFKCRRNIEKNMTILPSSF